jgi:atlastin
LPLESQHFEDEDEDDFEAMETSMTEYLAKVIAEREATDLKETREQILGCFDKITCYGLCHPGFTVTKKKYTGDVTGIEPLFLQLLDRYCKRIFDPNTLQAKMIHGRSLTAVELGSYVRAYAALFASGAKFPTAATLLEATASANNTNAIQLAMTEYKEQMDRIAGPRCNNFIKQDVFEEEHRRVLAKSLQVFESIATFGSSRSIELARSELQHKVNDSLETYESLNKSRNPLLGLETYLIPAAVGIVAYLLRILTDFTCSPYSQVCRVGSDFLVRCFVKMHRLSLFSC